MKLTDREFFCEHLDSEQEALRGVCGAAERGDFPEARRLFAAHVRSTIEPERFFGAFGKEAPDRERLLKKAELACRHYMVSCGIPYDFGDGPVIWDFNPTANQYPEWPFQLNRHAEWLTLAAAYRLTGERRYYEAFEEQLLSWLSQVPRPEAGTCNRTRTWRTIECGIRQGECWAEVFHTFYREMPDDVLTDFCKSVWEHGEVLATEHVKIGNWLLMEMNGLAHISVLHPWLREAKEWYSLARSILEENLESQIYPDGVQYELTTNYQYVTIINYILPIRLFRAYGYEVPPAMMEILRGTLYCYMRMMRPDGHTVDINDGRYFDVQWIMRQMEPLFDDDPILRWAAGRDGGRMPEEASYIFEYPGLAALRTGWEKEDTFVFFDGGEFGVAHQHEDKLSLVLYADGEQVLTEGNNYAYDSSEMRKYVLSTRAHNTALVDRMGQNRRMGYKWDPARRTQKSDLRFTLTDAADALRAAYDEGYGPDAVRGVRHERSVYFVKKLADLQPFVIVCDRFTAEEAHTYSLLWHLDAPEIFQRGTALTAKTLHLSVSDPEAGLLLTRGAVSPEWQGWTADSAIQGDYRPVYCAEYQLCAASRRLVTVLYPDGGRALSVEAVEASADVSDTSLTLVCSDGRRFTLSEEDFLAR